MSVTDRTMLAIVRVWVIFSLSMRQAAAWGNNNNDNSEDLSMYGNALNRDWLYDSTSISLKLEGCMWGYVEDNEDSGCMEDSSEDGTSYWYQMANCRRAQAVFSVYAGSSSNTGCNKNTFKETFVSRNGLSEFIYYLTQYDANNPFGDYYAGGGDDDGGDDAVQDDGDYDDLPMCEQSDNGYIGLGCASDGTFTLQYFNDAYCLQPSGKTYNKLKQLNQALKTYRNCEGIYYYGSENNLAQILSYNADSCSSLDSSLCTDNTSMKTRRSSTGGKSSRANPGSHTWVTKLKYVAGGMLLLASFVMFTGILFTNRRRRRALMQRKYRQAKLRDDRSRRSKRSKSKSRRSKSKSRSSSKSKSEGVFT